MRNPGLVPGFCFSALAFMLVPHPRHRFVAFGARLFLQRGNDIIHMRRDRRPCGSRIAGLNRIVDGAVLIQQHVAGHAIVAGDGDAAALAHRMLGEAPETVRRHFAR